MEKCLYNFNNNQLKGEKQGKMMAYYHPTECLPLFKKLVENSFGMSMHPTELRSCVNVEVAALGFPSLISLMVSVDMCTPAKSQFQVRQPFLTCLTVFLPALWRLQVNLCFQRVAADILNIKLTKPDVEQQQRVVKAEVIHYKNDLAAAKPTPSETKSSFCSVQ